MDLSKVKKEMDLSKVKVGDEVFSILRECGKVITKSDNLFQVEFKNCNSCEYTFDGRYFSNDINPEIIDWWPQREEWMPQFHLVKYDGLQTIKCCKIFCSYVAELAPDWKADWDNPDQLKHYVYYDHFAKEWRNTYSSETYQLPSTVYMSQEIAVQLRKDLNDGVVKL